MGILLLKGAQASGVNGSRSTVVPHLTRQSREARRYAPLARRGQSS
jgi:hypothetical protein